MCGYVLARTDEQVWAFLNCVLGLGLGLRKVCASWFGPGEFGLA